MEDKLEGRRSEYPGAMGKQRQVAVCHRAVPRDGPTGMGWDGMGRLVVMGMGWDGMGRLVVHPYPAGISGW